MSFEYQFKESFQYRAGIVYRSPPPPKPCRDLSEEEKEINLFVDSLIKTPEELEIEEISKLVEKSLEYYRYFKSTRLDWSKPELFNRFVSLLNEHLEVSIVHK